MKQTKAQRDAPRPISTGSRLRDRLDRIYDNTDALTAGSLPSLELLRLLTAQRRLTNQAMDLGILLSRQKGMSWSQIAGAVGLSPQAIEQRMRRLASTSVDDVSAA